jgi:CubicO group peptidase (beta-lactamase class C family)
MLDHAVVPETRPPVRTSRSPSPPEFSQLRLARMRAALQRHIDSGHTPGIVALVHQRGRTHVDVLGTTAFGSAEPMRRDTIFRLASTTKPITAVGAMVLVEECAIRLDDPVDPWLPELQGRRVLRTIDGPLDDTVPATRAITLRDLLTFRSGYGEVGFIAPGCPLQQALAAARLPLSAWPFEGTADEFMQRLGELPLAAQPGERWLYHMGSEILGVLIARVSGTTLGSFLAERVFGPLGMADTGFHVPPDELHRLPVCYATDMAAGTRMVLHEAGSGYAANQAGFESGAGGLVSTADDLLAFGRMMLLQGRHVLSRPSIELMAMDHLTTAQKTMSPFFPNFWDTRGWGLGMGIVTARADIADTPGRFGWDGAFGTSWYVDPREELVGVLLTQRTPERLALSPLNLDFWTAAYQLIED